MKKLFISIVMAMMLFSCTKKDTYEIKKLKDGTTKFENIKPSQPDLKIDFTLDCTIPFSFENQKGETIAFRNPRSTTKDSEGNIFVFDGADCKIYKFTPQGKFISFFGGKGDGPGEFRDLNTSAIINDTIYISDPNSQKIVMFDTSGNFTGNILTENRSPKFLKAADNNSIIGSSIQFRPDDKGTGAILQTSLNMYDLKFNKQQSLFTREKVINPNNPQLNPNEILPYYTCMSERIAVGHIDKNTYQIDMFDLTGKKQAVISKRYRKIVMSSEEMKSLASFVQLGGESKNEIKKEYHYAINGLWSDKFNNLWVLSVNENQRSNDKELWFDIYHDNILLNSVKFPYFNSYYDMGLQWSFNMVGDKICFIDSENEKVMIYKFSM